MAPTLHIYNLECNLTLQPDLCHAVNSVMDDNRLLTLPSNERIRLLPHMKLIFEIRDLKYATPATGQRGLAFAKRICRQAVIWCRMKYDRC